MKATKIEFKLRFWIITSLYILGFLAPWQYLANNPHQPRLWSWLALQLFATGALTSQQAFIAVLIAAIALAIAGALLRLIGTAHLGSHTMQASTPQAARIIATGPYRLIRNPLYLGTWLTAIAVSLLMPFTGALLFIAALALFELRLIGAEESHLTSQLGEAYVTYRNQTGRLLPRLRRKPTAARAVAETKPREDFKAVSNAPSPAQPDRPRWFEALAAEIFPVGVALTLATLGWTYDAPLLTRAIIISFGASLVAKALMPQSSSDLDSSSAPT